MVLTACALAFSALTATAVPAADAPSTTPTPIELPAEPMASSVTQKIDLLERIRQNQVTYHISTKADVKAPANEVFTFQPDGQFRVSGQGYGGVATNESFRDYHLVIEFRWGEKTWGKREKAARDSGVLVHAFGPQGTMNDAWMASIEAQIIEGGVGDILVLSPKLADGRVLQASISAETGRDRDKEWVWTPDAPRQVMTGGRLNWQKRDVDWKDAVGFRGRDDVESPFGQWTRLEVIAKGDTLEYLVNGVLVNRAFAVTPSQGRIQLQTEGAEMFVRRYELHPLGRFHETWPPPTAAKPAHGEDGDLPAYSRRPTVLELTPEQARVPAPSAKLPPGFELIVAAHAPMVANPTMGCVDDRGRLFIGDSAGVNWSAAKFEAKLPNRVLMLEDRDGDGVFDRSTIFADKLTVPKGGCWVDGSLYVASPPGIWKFTDRNDDGIAEERELVVGGFAWTANGADCHGPRQHPDGRLYWTHGRKGHVVKQRDGTLVHEGLNSGIWSMNPDGSDIRWHALGCADNPVGLDFTPDGDLIGTTDLYFGSPRVDTLMHWQLGGVYERPDFLRIIANLPRTHERMPILKDLGHVVPSGSCFWKSANALAPSGQAWSADAKALQYLVAFYNSQQVKRFELKPDGSTWRAEEHEFLTVERTGAHLSDVIEAPDGSLLVVDTGSWYSHCPSSLADAGTIPGQIYRIRRTADAAAQHAGVRAAHRPFTQTPRATDDQLVAQLGAPDPAAVRRALEGLTFRATRSPAISQVLLTLLDQPADAVLEHALLTAGMTIGEFTADTLDAARSPRQQARLLRILSQTRRKAADYDRIVQFALANAAANDATLAHHAYLALMRAPDLERRLPPTFAGWLTSPTPTTAQITALETFASALATKPAMAEHVAAMLRHPNPAVQQAALRALANVTGKIDASAWHEPLSALLARGPSAVLLDALAAVKDSRFDAALSAVAADNAQPAALRLKALLALSSTGATTVSEPAFVLLMQVLVDPAHPGLRLDAARRLANAALTSAQWDAYLAVLPSTGPLEQSELLVALAVPQVYQRVPPDLAKRIAAAFAKSPMLGTFRQDLVRKAFGFTTRDAYAVLEPAFQAALAANEAKKDRMNALAAAAASRGNASAGRAVYEAGKGICITCHRIGNQGRELGPNLTHIGSIRLERELIESILFPSNNIARDYDLHSFQLTDGATVLGLIKARGADGITITEASGQVRVLPQESIASTTMLTTSLMPPGLDALLGEQDLLDLVAYLRSLK
jgi:putative heme-binding domain-containing protein